jgi:hypothetical protein
MDKTEIERGIAGYRHQQEVLTRLLRRRGGFTEKDFDRWFQGREFRKRCLLRPHGVTGDSFILGIGANGGNMWAEYLELMQYMIRLGKIDAKKIDGVVKYSLLH